MSDYGIKVVKAGADITSNNILDINMSSQYSMFKYSLVDTYATITVNGGGTAGTAIIPHNLGYIPAFVAYGASVNTYGTTTVTTLTSLPFAAITIAGTLDYNDTYVDGTNVYITQRYQDPIGLDTYSVSEYYNEASSAYTSVRIGKDALDNIRNCAMKFDYININNGNEITSAYIKFYVSATGSGTSNVKFKTWGMDVDNVNSFFDEYPMSITKTTAVTTQEQSMVSTPFDYNIDVTDSLKEISNRGGWSSGNNVGFILNDNGSNTDCTLFDNTFGSQLIITKPDSSVTTYRAIVFKDKII